MGRISNGFLIPKIEVTTADNLISVASARWIFFYRACGFCRHLSEFRKTFKTADDAALRLGKEETNSADQALGESFTFLPVVQMFGTEIFQPDFAGLHGEEGTQRFEFCGRASDQFAA